MDKQQVLDHLIAHKDRPLGDNQVRSQLTGYVVIRLAII